MSIKIWRLFFLATSNLLLELPLLTTNRQKS